MMKERVIASKKMKTIAKPKNVIDLGEELLIFGQFHVLIWRTLIYQ